MRRLLIFSTSLAARSPRRIAPPMNESLQVFREAEAAKTKPGRKEGRSDAWVEPHGMDHFFYIRIELFG